MQTWQPVTKDDEYLEAGDTHYFETRQWSYYWNPVKSTVRRYGIDGSFEEYVSRRGRPDNPEVPLGAYLSGRFAYQRRQGQLYAEAA